MKNKVQIVTGILLAASLFVGCSNSATSSIASSKEVALQEQSGGIAGSSSSSADEAAITESDAEIANAFLDLIQKNNTLMMWYSFHINEDEFLDYTLPTYPIEGNANAEWVASAVYKTKADLVNAFNEIYTESFTQSQLDSDFNGKYPRLKEIDGRLYVSTAGGGVNFNKVVDKNTIVVTRKENNMVEVGCSYYFEDATISEILNDTFTMVKTEKGYRFTVFV